jgi:glutamate/tyrosine decarboxylase-like PLP-dependent enzyme
VETLYLNLLSEAVSDFGRAIGKYGHFEPSGHIDRSKLTSVLGQYMDRIKGNYPFAHPAYAGQMLKPPHPAAWLGYSIAMMVNANNHALDGGPDTSVMEKELILDFVRFFGFPEHSLGHLTASGTIANLEALWIARCIHPGKAVAFSRNAHYTHSRMCSVLGLDAIVIDDDESGHPSITHLEALSDRIGTLVVTMGTTGLGQVEPLDKLLPACKELGIRVHIDAAYGGFFKALVGTGLIDDTPWQFVGLADSLVVDPHKHGLQPYGCGCVLFRDPSIGHFYKHDSPYTYFTSDELHLGEISLECSRPGAAAASLWLTLKLLPLDTDDGLREVLSECRMAAKELATSLSTSPDWYLYTEPELDIVAYYPEPSVPHVDIVHRLCSGIMRSGMHGPEQDRIFLSLFNVPVSTLASTHPDWAVNTSLERIAILRSVLMKPEHRNFVPELMRRLNHHLNLKTLT